MTDDSGSAGGVELLPCPFCGNNGHGPVEDALHVCHVEDDQHVAYDRYCAQCDKCTATMGYSDSEEEAISAWNTRLAAPAEVDAIAQAHAAGRAEGLEEAAKVADSAAANHAHQERVYRRKLEKRDFESMALADRLIATAIRARITTLTGGKA